VARVLLGARTRARDGWGGKSSAAKPALEGVSERWFRPARVNGCLAARVAGGCPARHDFTLADLSAKFWLYGRICGSEWHTSGQASPLCVASGGDASLRVNDIILLRLS